MAIKQVPSLGRIVHYRWHGLVSAAIITAVLIPDDPYSPVTMAIFTTNMFAFSGDTPHASRAGEDADAARWDWPPFVPGVEVPDGE